MTPGSSEVVPGHTVTMSSYPATPFSLGKQEVPERSMEVYLSALFEIMSNEQTSKELT